MPESSSNPRSSHKCIGSATAPGRARGLIASPIAAHPDTQSPWERTVRENQNMAPLQRKIPSHDTSPAATLMAERHLFVLPPRYRGSHVFCWWHAVGRVGRSGRTVGVVGRFGPSQAVRCACRSAGRSDNWLVRLVGRHGHASPHRHRRAGGSLVELPARRPGQSNDCPESPGLAGAGAPHESGATPRRLRSNGSPDSTRVASHHASPKGSTRRAGKGGALHHDSAMT